MCVTTSFFWRESTATVSFPSWAGGLGLSLGRHCVPDTFNLALHASMCHHFVLLARVHSHGLLPSSEITMAV